MYNPYGAQGQPQGQQVPMQNLYGGAQMGGQPMGGQMMGGQMMGGQMMGGQMQMGGQMMGGQMQMGGVPMGGQVQMGGQMPMGGAAMPMGGGGMQMGGAGGLYGGVQMGQPQAQPQPQPQPPVQVQPPVGGAGGLYGGVQMGGAQVQPQHPPVATDPPQAEDSTPTFTIGAPTTQDRPPLAPTTTQPASTVPAATTTDSHSAHNDVELRPTAESDAHHRPLQRGDTAFRMSIRDVSSITQSLFKNVNPFSEETYADAEEVEDGFEIRHLPNGTAYMHKLEPWELKEKRHQLREDRRAHGEEVDTSSDEDDDEEAANEYINRKPPNCCSSHKTLERAYGIGVRLYFDFALIILLWNLFFFGVQLIPTVFNLAYEGNTLEDWYDEENNVTERISMLKANWRENAGSFFFTSHWDPGVTVWVWRVTNILIIFLSILFVAPCYYCFTWCLFRQRGAADAEGFIANEELDRIPRPPEEHHTKNERLCRVFASYCLFVVLIAGQLVVVLGLQFANNTAAVKDALKAEVSSVTSQSWINVIVTYAVSIAISMLITVLNMIWKKLCGVLTNFEKHRTWSTFRKHHTFKMVLFKILNVFFMGMVKGFLTNKCIMDVLGTQYMIQLIMDVFVMNIVEMVMPVIKYMIKRSKIPKDGNRRVIEMEKIKPDFDVSDEYYELIYRQYVIYVAMPSFPYITILAVISSAFELFVDKIKLIYMSKKPPDTRGSVKSVVSFFLFFAALMAALNWGGGSAYTLSGYYWCNDISGYGVNKVPCRIIPNEMCVDIVSNTWNIPIPIVNATNATMVL